MADRSVLVVGTTSDYIDIIRQRFPGRTLFLTDIECRANAIEPAPPAPTELLSDLACGDETLSKLRKHIGQHGIELSGMVCFDCESMMLAANIARALSLPYVSPEAVSVCRSKYECKQLWREMNLPCPQAELVKSAAEAKAFLQKTGGAAVLKPVAGSGSEYVFICSNDDECEKAFSTIESKLSVLRSNPGKPLYSRDLSEAKKQCICVMEEFIQGDEYSCDFVIDGNRLEIIRIARKIHAIGMSFGTTLAYVVPTDLPGTLRTEDLCRQLRAAAQALGLDRAICMIDLMVRDGKALMIEMTPRPGGDCLPSLLMKSGGLDILGLAIDFAEGRFPSIPEKAEWKRLVGLRLFATKSGRITQMNADALLADDRVVEYHAKAGSGHTVVLPPDDYDSRLLGHVIFKPSEPGISAIEKECLEIAGLLKLELKTT